MWNWIYQEWSGDNWLMLNFQFAKLCYIDFLFFPLKPIWHLTHLLLKWYKTEICKYCLAPVTCRQLELWLCRYFIIEYHWCLINLFVNFQFILLLFRNHFNHYPFFHSVTPLFSKVTYPLLLGWNTAHVTEDLTLQPAKAPWSSNNTSPAHPQQTSIQR